MNFQEGFGRAGLKVFFMPTIYSRLKVYCDQNKKNIPSLIERGNIGKEVIKKFYEVRDYKDMYNWVNARSEDGDFKIISYPKKYIWLIDNIIKKYFESLPKKRIRKRIYLE